jgi:hypothetical protein
MSKPIRTIRLTSYVPEEWVSGLEGKHIGSNHIEHLIGGTDGVGTDVRKPDGSLLLAYRREAIPLEAIPPQARSALRRIARPTESRVTASGGARVRSGIAGFVDGFGHYPFCRMTAFTRDDRDGWVGLNDYMLANDAVLRQACPQHYAHRLKLAARIHPYWRIPGTVFTTLTVNVNYSSTVHRDGGNLGLSVLAVLRTGHPKGGVLVLPKWRVGVDLGHRDVVIADLARELHANTELLCAGNAERLSTVLYLRAGVVGAGTPAEEWEKARRRRM